jgi:urease accessory protein
VLLTLLQLADSALPIGAASHSFGIETLVAEGAVTVEALPEFLSAYLEECLLCEAVFLNHAWRLSGTFSYDQWDRLGHELSARKPAREPRLASIALGRRFLRLAHSLHPRKVFEDALQSDEVHHCNAFGLACGALDIPSDWATLAYLQQAITGIVSACQRLMPLGQSAAGLLVRNLQGEIRSAATRTATLQLGDIQSFAPSFELAGMRHPRLATRLFIS